MQEHSDCMDDILTDVSFGAGGSAIENPRYSRPLDVHRWTEHTELISVLDQIWVTHCQELGAQGRSGPKPKREFRHQLRVVLLDLYVAWLEDPELSIGVSMSENDWHIWSRYNALNISKKIIELIHLLHRVGLIDLAKGSYSGPSAPGNRITRIRAAEPLRALFRTANAERTCVYQVKDQECIILKSGDTEEAKLIEYEDTPETNTMRAELQAYNLLLADSFIDIPVLDDPWIVRMDGGRVLVDPQHQFVRRIFSRGNWRCNGRFYGPWWQQIGSEWRSKIYINDKPTVEVDFKGLHIQLLSARKGVSLDGDPYALPGGLLEGVPDDMQRVIVKKLVLTALNARARKASFASFRDGFPTGHLAKKLKNTQLDTILSAFIGKYPHLEDALCTDQGIGLMNLDAQIAEIVIRYFTTRNVPVLSVHDSFIISQDRVQELQRVLAFASRRVSGRSLPVELKTIQQNEEQDPKSALALHAWSKTERTEGYLRRLKAWEKNKKEQVNTQLGGEEQTRPFMFLPVPSLPSITYAYPSAREVGQQMGQFRRYLQSLTIRRNDTTNRVSDWLGR